MENATKLTIVYIMEILRQRTSRSRRMTQQDLVDVMRGEYGVECERKSVSRNINALVSAGYPIEYRQGYFWNADPESGDFRPVLRRRPAGEQQDQPEDSAQSDSLRALSQEARADELQAKLLKAEANISISETRAKAEEAKARAAKQRAAVLEERLTELESRTGGPISTLRHYTNLAGDSILTPAIFESHIKPADTAIQLGRQLSFFYNGYDDLLRLIPLSPQPYLVNPYHIYENDGRFFLLCAHAASPDQLIYLKFWRMSDVCVENTAALPFEQVQPGFSPGQHSPATRAERLYMLSGEPEVITIRVVADLLSEVVDWLGTDLDIKPSVTKKYMIITFCANPAAIIFWAMQYGSLVEIQRPQFLRQAVADALEEAASLYR